MENFGNLDLWQLMPNWSLVQDGFPTTGDALSTWGVVILLSLFGVSILYLLINVGYTKIQLNRLKDIYKGVSVETFPEKRIDLREKAQKLNNRYGRLWHEFDQTLLEIKKEDGSVELRATTNPNYFFNHAYLASRLTESRFLAAIPSFLTAVGVVGTFIGLQLGLSELNIGSEATIAEMKGGIAGVINGAKIAFITSVWGVFLSVFFNFIEKVAAGCARTSISKIPLEIERFIPSITPESQLHRIAQDGHQSRETLQGLAEEIGVKMQESLAEVGQRIETGLKNSITEVMTPALDRLAQETSSSSQTALDSLMTNFMDKFGEAGHQQRQAMDEASLHIKDALGSFDKVIHKFLEEIERTRAESNQREDALIAKISHQVDELVTKTTFQNEKLTTFIEKSLTDLSSNQDSREQVSLEREKARGEEFIAQQTRLTSFMETTLKELAAQQDAREQASQEREKAHNEKIAQQNAQVASSMQEALGDLQKTFDNREEASHARENARREEFSSHINSIKNGMTEFLAHVHDRDQEQNRIIAQLLQQSSELQTAINQSSEANKESTANMRIVALEMGASSRKLEELGRGVSDATQHLKEEIQTAVTTTVDLAQDNKKIAENVQLINTQIERNLTQYKDLGETLVALIEKADSSFDKMNDSQHELLNGLKQNVEDLSVKMTNLLQEYALQANGQTKEHLQIWAQGTTQYSAAMQSAVEALSSVIDEIETKMGR